MSRPSLDSLRLAVSRMADNPDLPDENPATLAALLLAMLHQVWEDIPHAERCGLAGVASQLLRMGMREVEQSGLSLEDYLARLSGGVQ